MSQRDGDAIKAAARREGINARAFRKYVEEIKYQEGRGGADNLKFQRLLELAREFKELFGTK